MELPRPLLLEKIMIKILEILENFTKFSFDRIQVILI